MIHPIFPSYFFQKQVQKKIAGLVTPELTLGSEAEKDKSRKRQK
jgi:hypothetical protein